MRTNLALLQHVCESVGQPVPTALPSLTTPQDQILRMLDEHSRRIASMKEWSFLQRTSQFQCWPYASGSSCNVATLALSVDTDDPFSTDTANVKMVIDSATSGYGTDVVRVNPTTTDDATIISTWGRGNVTGKNWKMGVDEYTLETNCESVSWMYTAHYSGTVERFKPMRGVSWEEMEAIRSERTDYVHDATPEVYCVLQHGVTADHIRRVVIDPFPVWNQMIHYGYQKKPDTLYSGSLVYADIPPKWLPILADLAALDYYATFGTGGNQGSTAGAELGNRIVELQKLADARLSRMLTEERIAEPRPSMDPASTSRIFYQQRS